ncbi:YybH family protein [Hyphococcus sp.]|uniref:YybH family protein n=1 Tax=Hyphococcus sp. TaxID=2038636 RepID=UPI0037538678
MKKLLASGLAATMLATSAVYAGPLEDMLAADTAFAKMAQDESVPAAFAAYAAEDVWMFPEGQDAYQGRDKLVARFAGWPEGATLEWFPQNGMAASGGDFGFTWGRYTFTAKSDSGDNVGHGKYVSIWRKENGAWKFVADIGNSGPSPEANPKAED